MSVRINVHKCAVGSTAQNGSDNLPSYPPNNHHWSDVVYWRWWRCGPKTEFCYATDHSR